jgi:hypothetical protein
MIRNRNTYVHMNQDSRIILYEILCVYRYICIINYPIYQGIATSSQRIKLTTPRLSSSPNPLRPAQERAPYGLSKDSLSMLVTGATFNVPNFLGLKSVKFFFVTPDIENIGSRSMSGKHQVLTPFNHFHSVHILKGIITLEGRSGAKSLIIEYTSKLGTFEFLFLCYTCSKDMYVFIDF